MRRALSFLFRCNQVYCCSPLLLANIEFVRNGACSNARPARFCAPHLACCLGHASHCPTARALGAPRLPASLEQACRYSSRLSGARKYRQPDSFFS